MFNGEVTPADASEWAEQLDDDLDLAQNLKGKSWTSIPRDFVERHYSDLPLLTPLAFASFLPAWLLCALETLDGTNDVRDHVVFHFFPHESDRKFPILAAWREDRLNRLSEEQRSVIRRFLEFVANRERSRFVRDKALEALGPPSAEVDRKALPPRES